ncbi:MAG: hypothetical protein ACYTDU_18365 [Planctomycetota bacterium]|jgi:hypothetical protein
MLPTRWLPLLVLAGLLELSGRLFVLGADGKTAYRGERGPRGFRVAELEKALGKLVATD